MNLILGAGAESKGSAGILPASAGILPASSMTGDRPMEQRRAPMPLAGCLRSPSDPRANVVPSGLLPDIVGFLGL